MKKYITKQSNIKGAGKGLFTNASFKKGDVIGLAHVNNQPATEIGKNHNHNEKNPTANNIKDGNKRYLIASRNLKPGEEITTNYRLQPELEQPEDFMQKGGMTPQKDGYRTYSPFKNLPFIDVETDTIDTDNIVYDLQLRADNGVTKNVQKNTGLHKIPGATVIREIPMGRKGGSAPKLPRKKNSKGYSRSLEATNRFFAEHAFFAKPKSRKNKIYDPNAKYYQDGGDLPQNVGITYLSEDDRSHYSPLDDTIYLNPNASDAELNHELVHAWQNRTGRLRSNPNLPQQRPPIVASDEQAASYYTRKGDDVDYYLNNLSTLYPNLTDGNIWTEDINRFIPEQIKYDKVIDPLMYLDPNTMEGEAEMFSQVYGPPPGISFRKKGGALPKAQDGIPQEFYQNWYQNRIMPTPEGQKLLDKIRPEALERSRQMIPYIYSDKLKPDDAGYYDTKTQEIILNKFLPEAQIEATKQHEFGHHIQAGDKFYNVLDKPHQFLVEQNIIEPEKISTGNSEWDEKLKENYDYVTQPDEMHARVMTLRRLAGFQPNQVITEKDLKDYFNRVKEAGEALDPDIEDLRGVTKGNQSIVNLLNDMVSVPSNREDLNVAQDGGEQDGMLGMMKSKLAYANEFRNPAAKRMINIPDNPYDFGNGMTGTHYMASMDNYAVPQIQDENGQLVLGDYGPDSKEAIKFDRPEDAEYFAKHYKEVSPGFIEAELTPEEIEEYVKGGYIIEDISVPSLTKRKFAPGGVTDLNPITMAKYLADLKVQENNEKKGFKNNKWYPHRSVEGGADTIGYGHKLTKADSKFYKGITTDEVEKLLQADVLIKQSEAKKRVDKKYGVGTFDALPQDSQMLVVDYQYNVGLQEFPKFLDALVKGDKETMLKEYERTSSSGKLTKRNNWAKSVIDNLNYNTDEVPIQSNIPLANVPDNTVVVPQVIPETIEEIKYQDGGDVISQYGWDYKTDGDKYLTKRTGTENWIQAKGSSLDAIKQKVYNKPIDSIVPTEETSILEIPDEVKKDSLPVKASVIEIQQRLKKAGYNLGKFGPNKDGIDGQMGNITKLALDAFNAGISPDKVKIPNPKKKIKGEEVNYTVNANLKDGYLPYLNIKEDICTKDKGCSYNVSVKIANLLSNITEESLWANDAWYNKDAIIKQGGDLIYESPSRIYNQMGKVPKEVWSKLQVGDYVQLNRPDTKSSAEFIAKGPSDEGYINEEIEHLGFIVGKDKDGTPLIWHGSEKGKAFIKRIDEPISLDDHNKDIFTYQVSSIVRSPVLKNANFSGLQNSAYYTPLDKSKKLVAKKSATPLQVEATNIFNDSVGQFKNLGYSQDDANYIGGLLIGGIMEQETGGGTSRKAGPKESAATLIKNVAGINAFDVPGTDNELYKFTAQLVGGTGKPLRFPGKEFEGDEASVGQYQLKPNLNFRESNGSLNALGKKLKKLGINVEDIDSGNIDYQTKAGTLLLLDAYTSLKKDPDFNIKTGLYKNKIPASYIIAKSWQAGKGWYKKDKYKKYLNDFDIDYSNNVIKSTLNNIHYINSDKNLYNEYTIIKKGDALAKQQERIRLSKEQIKKDDEYKKANPNYAYKKLIPSESTSINKIDINSLKPFNANNYFSKNNMQKTVYKYSGRPNAKYKKDKNGNWYVNDGKSTNNKYITLNDPDGKRSRVLEKFAKPLIEKAKEGGIVINLSQNEINKYIRNGYVVEELD